MSRCLKWGGFHTPLVLGDWVMENERDLIRTFQVMLNKHNLSSIKVIKAKFERESFGGTRVYNLECELKGKRLKTTGVLTGWDKTNGIDLPPLSLSEADGLESLTDWEYTSGGDYRRHAAGAQNADSSTPR